ncbi:MAG TPA: YtrH family sporulation protein [Thermoclostridium sp.]|nr:sporulation protein [Clostridiaceae bacterium]HOQ75852.1 YtrH family sporulation protein [Thermoclostridium sp.]
MPSFLAGILRNFLVAFGVVIGASVFAGISAIIANKPPLEAMMEIAGSIKIWAMAIALGDTFSSFKAIEKGIFQGEFLSIVKQGAHVVTALLGANAAYGYIRLIQRLGALWGE